MTLAEKKDKAKLVLQKKIATPKSKEELEALSAAQSYENQLLKYRKDPAGHYLGKKTLEDPKLLTLWRSVFILSELCEATVDDYIHAQFWFCDKYINRAPKPQELVYVNTKVPSVKRYEIYKEQSGSSAITTSVVPKGGYVSPSSELKNSVSEKLFRQYVSKYNLTEEEVFIRLYKEGTYYFFFDKKWFESHEIYQKLKQANLI